MPELGKNISTGSVDGEINNISRQISVKSMTMASTGRGATRYNTRKLSTANLAKMAHNVLAPQPEHLPETQRTDESE